MQWLQRVGVYGSGSGLRLFCLGVEVLCWGWLGIGSWGLGSGFEVTLTLGRACAVAARIRDFGLKVWVQGYWCVGWSFVLELAGGWELGVGVRVRGYADLPPRGRVCAVAAGRVV